MNSKISGMNHENFQMKSSWYDEFYAVEKALQTLLKIFESIVLSCL